MPPFARLYAVPHNLYWEVFGVENGYRGLIDGNFTRLGMRDVGNIIQLGGTVLGSARAPEFKNIEGQQEGIRRLHQQGIDALVVIGGNGSQTGAYALRHTRLSCGGGCFYH
jgi:6-phosphofructokinase 1